MKWGTIMQENAIEFGKAVQYGQLMVPIPITSLALELISTTASL